MSPLCYVTSSRRGAICTKPVTETIAKAVEGTTCRTRQKCVLLGRLIGEKIIPDSKPRKIRCRMGNKLHLYSKPDNNAITV